ncbi:MAG TPA: GNAT family N-acetyltransferase [Ferruginibacter sp.]|nr:GNAT family N-acetyltransferase [Ferruginibacter sp.]
MENYSAFLSKLNKIIFMQIEHKETGNKGAFFVGTADSILAEMTYSLSPGIMIIDHTEVDDSLRGKSVGKQLFDHAIEYAREKSLKIIPLCPYAKSVFDKNPEAYKDVLKQ